MTLSLLQNVDIAERLPPQTGSSSCSHAVAAYFLDLQNRDVFKIVQASSRNSTTHVTTGDIVCEHGALVMPGIRFNA